MILPSTSTAKKPLLLVQLSYDIKLHFVSFDKNSISYANGHIITIFLVLFDSHLYHMLILVIKYHTSAALLAVKLYMFKMSPTAAIKNNTM